MALGLHGNQVILNPSSDSPSISIDQNMADLARPDSPGKPAVDRHMSLTDRLDEMLAHSDKSILEEVETILSKPPTNPPEKEPTPTCGGGGMPGAPIIPVTTLPDTYGKHEEQKISEAGHSLSKITFECSDHEVNTENPEAQVYSDGQESDLIDCLPLDELSPTASTNLGVEKFTTDNNEEVSHSDRGVARIQHQSSNSQLGSRYYEESYGDYDEHDDDNNDMDDEMDDDVDDIYRPCYNNRRPHHEQIDPIDYNHVYLIDDDDDDYVLGTGSSHNPTAGVEADDAESETGSPLGAPRADASNQQDETSVSDGRQQGRDDHSANLLPSTASKLSSSQSQSQSEPQQPQPAPTAATGGCCDCFEVLRDQTEVASVFARGGSQTMRCHRCDGTSASAKGQRKRKLVRNCEAEFQNLNRELARTDRRLCSHCRRIWPIGVFYQGHGQGQGSRLLRQCWACRDVCSRYLRRRAAGQKAGIVGAGGDGGGDGAPATAAPEGKRSSNGKDGGKGKHNDSSNSRTISRYNNDNEIKPSDEAGGATPTHDSECSGSTYRSLPGRGVPVRAVLSLPPLRTKESGHRMALSSGSATPTTAVATTTTSTETSEGETAKPLAQRKGPPRSNKRRLSPASATFAPSSAIADRTKKLKRD